MGKLGIRLLGVLTLFLDPLLALWALRLFRDSPDPSDRSYPGLLKNMLRESWDMVRTGEWL